MENSRLRKELESTTRQLEAAKEAKSVSKKLITVPGSETSTPRSASDRGGAYDVLFAKHQLVKNHLKETESARSLLEERLRKKTSLARQWMEYSDGLKKKITKLEVLNEAHGVTVDDAQKANMIPPHTPRVDASSSPRQDPTVGKGAGFRRSASRLTVSYGDSELDGETVVGTPTEEAARKMSAPIDGQHIPKIRTARELEDKNTLDDPPVSRASRQLFGSGKFFGEDVESGHPRALTPRSATAIYPLVEASVTQKQNQRAYSSQSTNSSPTQSEPDDRTYPAVRSHPEYQIRETSQDTPVVVLCRAVKKNRSDMKNVSRPDEPRVKLEILSSSPMGLAGVQNFNASMDLDEIGEKVNTPKKSRQVLKKKSLSNISRSLQKPEPGNGLLTGNPSALRAVNTNLLVTPRTHGSSKRRRLNEHGASIFSEDGEHEPVVGKANDLSLGAGYMTAKLEKRLCGLLELSSPESPHLTLRTPGSMGTTNLPTNKSCPPTSSDLLHGDYEFYRNEKVSKTAALVNLNRTGVSLITNSELRINPSATVTPTASTTTRGGLSTTRSKSGMRNSRPLYKNFRSSLTNASAEVDGPEDEPLRARPVRRLGLEHFKVNSDTNQGYDFAFSDVVRGREQRKCLPGCTKPECCGNTFRKLAELSMWDQSTPTPSQAEYNDRLLKEHLGDNAAKLQKMTEGEKKELLIQAKAREISNKHGKHRHAYERRKSPPGFWRSDFPTTQEQENDRTEAAQRERELVIQRYEEAMRPGGAWMFRDE